MFSWFPGMSTPVAFLALVVGFGFIIFIHELGHFLAAKWVGIKVTQFAVGFGQSLLTWRKGIGFKVGSTEAVYEKRIADHLASTGQADRKLTATEELTLARELGLGETEYRLNWIPLGGYVKMLGQEDLNPEAVSADPRSFNAKSVGARALVVSAGVIMNLISAVIFFIIAFINGVAFPPAMVGDVLPNSPAATTYAKGYENDGKYRGIQTGDRILSINGKPMGDFMEVAVTSALSARGSTLNLTIERPGHEGELTYPLVATPDRQTNLLSLGIFPPRSLSLQMMPTTGPFADSGLKATMTAVEANGQPLKHFGDFDRIITEAKGKPVPVVFVDAKDATQKVTVDVAAYPLLSPSSDGKSMGNLAGLIPVTRVNSVIKDSPAEKAGLKDGDLIVQLGPVAWPDYLTLLNAVKEAGGQPLKLIVERDGQRVDLGTVTPNQKNQIGIYPAPAMDVPIISSTVASSPAGTGLQLPPGSKITSINDQPVTSWADLQRLMLEAGQALPEDGGSITVGYQLNLAGDIQAKAPITLDKAERDRLLLASWQPGLIEAFGDLREPLVAGSLWDAAALGITKTKHYMLQTYVTLLRLFQGTVKPSHLRGPVGIAHEGTRVAKLGWTYLLFFLGLISVNLAVVNFLPIPVVDGGLMVFLILEKIKGSPVSVRVQSWATMAGLALILSLFVLTLIYDVSRLIF